MMDKSVSWPIILIYYFSSTLAFMWTLVGQIVKDSVEAPKPLKYTPNFDANFKG
jgi:hypothetical protein